MLKKSMDVVIVGGGIVGLATAYFLGKKGIKSVVVDMDGVGKHASGFAFGLLNPLSGVGVPGPVFPLSNKGMDLHRELSHSLPEETGVNTDYRSRPSLNLSFTEQDVQEAKAILPWIRQQHGFSCSWIENPELMDIERRLSERVLGALYIKGTADVEPYRFTLALAQAAENMGAVIQHGRVVGVNLKNGRAVGVFLENGDIPCGGVVLAMGPWSGEVSSWLGIRIEVAPLKGQIIRLRAPGAPFRQSIGWQGNYATTKPDGLLWAGTTEEEEGFDESPTRQGQDSIMTSLLKMIPFLDDAQLVRHTACLRPLSQDHLPVLGAVPGCEGVYLSTGAGRQGILLGPAMGKIAADLATGVTADIPIEIFSPGRFAV